MNRDAILRVFRQLAMSQGFYGRLLRDINNDPEWGDVLLSELESQNFPDACSLVMALEG